MENPEKRTWAEIRLGDLEHNCRELRQKLPEGCRFLGVCKADAYGHGAVPVARRLEAAGADYLAVACFDEAAELRAAGLALPLLVLSPSPAFLAPALAALPAEQAVGDLETARAMSAALAGTGLRLRCHLKLETGMGRTGLAARAERLEDALAMLGLPGLDFVGVFTHFAVSDEPASDFTDRQFARFTAMADELERRSGRRLLRHCANSGATVNFRDRMGLDMARPGLLLYGLYPGAARGGLDLRPVMRLKTRVYALTAHAAGDTVSYGRTFTCARDTRLAVLPIGYADGLHRALSNKLEVVVRGRRARQVGRICMDACMIDVTDIPGVEVGDVVTVFGDEPHVDELAEKAGTISYELVCAVSPRVPRVYLEG